MSERVKFQSKSGEEISGALALPEGKKVPALVLVQEWWGVNAHIESLVDRFAKAGFLVLAPDLYRGVVVKAGDAETAQKLMVALDGARALGDIAGAVAYLAHHPQGNGKVGILGFCMGGAYAFAAASRIPEIGAAVPFYGIPPEGNADWPNLKAPVQAHFANKDQWATVAKAVEVQKKIASLGGSMELHTYDADHAFVNDTRPEVYSRDNAELAIGRAVTFLHHHLG